MDCSAMGSSGQSSDEAKFEVCVRFSKSRVIRRKHEAFHPDCLKRKVKFPASVKVWGSMSSRGVGKLHFVEGTVDTNKYLDILEESILPVMEAHLISGQDFVFQQDGAAWHSSKKKYEMDGRLRKHPARTIPELKQRLQEIWDSFTPEFCQALVKTPPRRILDIIKRKGRCYPVINFEFIFVSILCIFCSFLICCYFALVIS